MCTSLYHILWNQNPYKFILLCRTEVKTTANVHRFKSLSVITDLHKNTDPIAPDRQSKKCHKVHAQYHWHNSNKWLLCRGFEIVPMFTDWMAELFLKNRKQEVWWQGGGGDLWILPKEYSGGEDTYSGGSHLIRWWPLQVVMSPIQESRSPIQVKSPIQEARPPIQEARPPIQVKSLIQEARPPIQGVRSPIQEVRSPIQEARSPIQEARSPIQEARSPIQEARSPIQEARPPIQEVRSPIQEARSPIQEVRSPK